MIVRMDVKMGLRIITIMAMMRVRIPGAGGMTMGTRIEHERTSTMRTTSITRTRNTDYPQT